MWITPKEGELTDQELTDICDKLKQDAIDNISTCHDCGADPFHLHMVGCDVERCAECGGQRIGCECDSKKRLPWTGIWPGYLECHELQLICKWNEDGDWRFDLNTLSIKERV